ncbi:MULTISPECIES: hypothetical protein [unclassified Nonomuraea]|uniref:hypothetical protein n=1 Tax=unclassified Nonomuraea TaxID=2593643 RepID=UPI0033E966DA
MERRDIEIPRQGGKIAHAEFRIGAAVFMLRDEHPEYHFRSPRTIGGLQFHGDPQVEQEDPFGHSWFFTSRVADMDAEQLTATASAVRL